MAELKYCDSSFLSRFDLLLMMVNVSPLLSASRLFRELPTPRSGAASGAPWHPLGVMENSQESGTT